jgi:hypothetical protein
VNLLGFQSQIVTPAYRTMTRATWPSALKVVHPGGLDIDLLREWRQHRADGTLILRQYFPDEHLVQAKFAPTFATAEMLREFDPIVECPINEASQTSAALIDELNAFTVAFVRECVARGFRPAVGVFGEGNPANLDWWVNFHPSLRAARAAGGYLALHEYGIPSLGFEDWHLLRHRRVWAVLPEDCKLPILVTECGIDGGIEGRTEVGWRGYMDAQAYAAWLRRYRQEIGADAYVHGATVFLCGGTDQWTLFDITDEVDLRGPFAEPVATPPRWTPPQEPTVTDWCPFAIREPLPAGLYDLRRDDGRPPSMNCDHIADGYGDPGPYWVSLLAKPPDQRASAHFWVSRLGELRQYVPISGQAWSNGPICQPNTLNPLIATLALQHINPNAVTISIEHEGKPGQACTPAQIATSRRLHVWLRDTVGIPLDRTHVVGHYEFDKCTRANCPGSAFPWTAILQGGTTPVFDFAKTLDQLWAIADTLATNGHPWLSQGIKSLVTLAKGEK